jgi:hypothetical protein
VTDDLRPWPGAGEPPAGYRRRTWAECIAAAGAALAAGIEHMESLSPRQAAEEAYRPGGPSVDEIEAQIRDFRQRYAAPELPPQDRSDPEDASPPTG